MTLRRTRLAVAGAFLTQGFVFISLTTRLPAFSDRWALSEVELSLLLLGLVLLAGVGTLVAERVAPRSGRPCRCAPRCWAPRSPSRRPRWRRTSAVFAAAVVRRTAWRSASSTR